jgi:hypothetical protein
VRGRTAAWPAEGGTSGPEDEGRQVAVAHHRPDRRAGTYGGSGAAAGRGGGARHSGGGG